MKSGPATAYLFIFFLVSFTAAAQSVQEDSLLFRSAVANTVKIYKQQLGDQSPLFNGSHFLTTGFEFRTGNPYFMSDSFRTGSVIYDDIEFDTLALLYEDLRGFLVLKNNNYPFQLINQRISSFEIAGHHFIRIVSDSSNTGLKRTGFYEVLYPGRSMVLKETIKAILEEASAYENTVIRHILTRYNYYIKTGKIYRKANSTAELLDIMSAHKKEIQHFMKKNKLKYRRDKEATLTQTAAYYDQIEK